MAIYSEREKELITENLRRFMQKEDASATVETARGYLDAEEWSAEDAMESFRADRRRQRASEIAAILLREFNGRGSATTYALNIAARSARTNEAMSRDYAEAAAILRAER